MASPMLSVTHREPSGHFVLVGRFDANEAAVFRGAVDGVLQSGAVDIVLDLSEVVFIDSSGLSELVRLMKSCRAQGGDLVIDGMSNAVQVILELTRLSSALTIR